MSPSNGRKGLYQVEALLLVNSGRDGAMRQRRPPIKRFEVRLVPSQEGIPPGDSNPYRYMDEDEREALLLESLMRILRACADSSDDQPAPDDRSA